MKTFLLFLFIFLSGLIQAQNGKFIGQIKINPLSDNQAINFYIMSGNPSTAFKIDSKTGNIFINNQTAIDAYTDWKYTLVVRLRYSIKGTNTILADTMRTIRILNLVNGKFICKVVASDPDNKNVTIQKLSYYFMSGNYSTAFKINGSTGNITVNNVSAINNWMKTKDRYILNVRVRDNGIPNLTSYGNVTILLFDGIVRQDVFNCRFFF